MKRLNRKKNGTIWGNGITQNVIWYVMKAGAARAGITALAPHDLRNYTESRTMPNLIDHVSRELNAKTASSISIRHSSGFGIAPQMPHAAFEKDMRSPLSSGGRRT